MFRIKVSEQSVEKIKSMDKWISSMLVAWIKKNISNCVNPRTFGKSLFKKDNRFWQYRLGDCRLLAIIYDDSKLLVFVDVHEGDTLE